MALGPIWSTAGSTGSCCCCNFCGACTGSGAVLVLPPGMPVKLCTLFVGGATWRGGGGISSSASSYCAHSPHTSVHQHARDEVVMQRERDFSHTLIRQQVFGEEWGKNVEKRTSPKLRLFRPDLLSRSICAAISSAFLASSGLIFDLSSFVV